MENTSTAMVSRSLRLRRDTLKVLHEEADKQGLGITVYIRTVLEALVSNIELDKPQVHIASYNETSLSYPEL